MQNLLLNHITFQNFDGPNSKISLTVNFITCTTTIINTEKLLNINAGKCVNAVIVQSNLKQQSNRKYIYTWNSFKSNSPLITKICTIIHVLIFIGKLYRVQIVLYMFQQATKRSYVKFNNWVIGLLRVFLKRKLPSWRCEI